MTASPDGPPGAFVEIRRSCSVEWSDDELLVIRHPIPDDYSFPDDHLESLLASSPILEIED